MINLQKLRHLSCICAYCGKIMQMNERTNDHIIPRSANGQTEANNIVICCQECNELKGSTLINDFLEKYPEKAEYELILLWREAPVDVRASIKNLLKHINK